METEQQLTPEQRLLETAWEAYRYWTGRDDEAGFRASYLGHYASRDAFGQELFATLGATTRLQRLPNWLQAYLRIDGTAVLRDFERDGQFWVYDMPNDGGCHVFDPYERPRS